MQAFRQLRERVGRIRPWVVDAALVLFVVAARLVQHDLDRAGHDPPIGGGLVATVALVAAVPLMLRRRFPFGVLLAVGVGELALLVLDVHAVPFALLIATYTVAACKSQRQSLAALVVVLGGTTIAVATIESAALVLESTVSLAMAWALGALQNARARHAAEVTQRLELLHREREVQAELAVAEERSRIARELHDVVAHGVSVMTMHAAGARRALREDQERADHALAEVERTGRRSLAELRQLLGVLDTHGDSADLAPQPGLSRLDELVAQYRRADMPIDLRVEGERRDLPSSVDLSAFRIVQEALTNVLKHAGPVPVTVALRYRDDALGIEVLNGGGSSRTNGRRTAGRGMIGMRERAVLLGGRFHAGPEPDGRFRVSCELPLTS